MSKKVRRYGKIFIVVVFCLASVISLGVFGTWNNTRAQNSVATADPNNGPDTSGDAGDENHTVVSEVRDELMDRRDYNAVFGR